VIRLVGVAGGLVLSLAAAAPHLRATVAPGGFVEHSSSSTVRPRLTAQQIQSFLPSRGRFTFPAPYLTEGARLTNAVDCGGDDCVRSVGYSYWRNISAHAGSPYLYVFLGLRTSAGGSGPTLFRYDKQTGEVTNLGGLMPAGSALASASGEGWYFSATMPTKLYIHSGSRFQRFDVETRTTETVYDLAPTYGSGRIVWQAHSSNDDRVHSATMKTSSGTSLGCVVYLEDEDRFRWFPANGAFDECQIDKSGRWLLIKENVDGSAGEDNRIIDLDTGVERVLYDQDGAAGHSDLGYGTMVAADNWSSHSGAVRVWDFSLPLPDATGQGVEVYRTLSWSAGMGHVTFANAPAGVAAADTFACASNATGSSVPRADELICYRLDGTQQALVVAPIMTDMGAAGGGDGYTKAPKANSDPYGEYAVWTTNLAGNRLDAILVRIPAHRIVDVGDDDPPNDPDAAPPVLGGIGTTGVTDTSAGVQWTTDEPADSTVEFGTGTSYGASAASASLATVHAVVLTGLAPSTTYHYRVRSTDAAGNAAVSSDRTFTTLAGSGGGGTGSAEPVVWTSLVNVTATGGSLQKTGGVTDYDDAGAVSAQTIAGAGWVEFRVDDPGPLVLCGLNANDAGPGAADIDFAIRIQSGIAEVRESGTYRGDVPAAAGDVFRVRVDDGGVVRYTRNGSVFRTSGLTASFPLRADASLYPMQAWIRDATISTATALEIPAPPTGVQVTGAGAELTIGWDLPDPSGSTATVTGFRLYPRLAGTTWASAPCAEVPLRYPEFYDDEGRLISVPVGHVAPLRDCAFAPATNVILAVRAVGPGGESSTSNEVVVPWPGLCAFATRAELLDCLGARAAR